MKWTASNDNSVSEESAGLWERDKAYDYGQEAAKQGLAPGTCPFDEDTEPNLEAAWMDGFYSISDVTDEWDEDEH